MGGSWRMEVRCPASTTLDGRAPRFTRPVAASRIATTDVRSDNDITGSRVLAAHSEETP